MMLGLVAIPLISINRMLTSTLFLSAGQLEDMSEESELSAYDALVKAVEYALKEKPDMLTGSPFSNITHCLAFKEGPYKDYYFFPAASRSKSDIIGNMYPLTGIYVHSHTGEVRYIERLDEKNELTKIYSDDYDDIYNMQAKEVVYKERVDVDDKLDEQAEKASRLLRRYLANKYPHIKKNQLNETICYVQGTKYFFPFWGSSRTELGFSIDIKEKTATLHILPLRDITW